MDYGLLSLVLLVLIVLYVNRNRILRRPAKEDAEAELAAVIAAAVAAASGLEPGSFRVVGIEPAAGAGSGRQGGPSAPWGRGLNTPAWGHVDRFIRGE